MAQTVSSTASIYAPISPTATATSPTLGRKHSTSHQLTIDIVPLDSPIRTTPIHPTLPTIKLPSYHATSNIHPLTLQPFTDHELKTLGYEKLRLEHENSKREDTEKARDEVVRVLREKIHEREAKEREIDREIDEKEKIREVERKVYRKKMGDKGKDGG